MNLFYFSPYSKLVYYTENSNYVEGKNYYWEQYHFYCDEKELRKNLFSNIKVILEKYKNIDPETKEMIAQTANALIKIVKNNLKNT